MHPSKRRPIESSETLDINLTPLIDVVFVVLIMFMVVAPLLELDRIDLAPSPDTSLSLSMVESSPLAIDVHSDNTIWFGKRQVSLAELRALLREGHELHPDKHPQLMQDRAAQFGLYQEVKNAAEAAGFDKLDVVLKPA